ncbi:MAG: Uma2 family endonuclease [Saprospiraceae bacterium]
MQATAIVAATIAAAPPATRRASRVRRKILTYEDYAAITPANNGNYELVNGNIVFMSSPTPRHQRVVRRLSNQLENLVRQNDLGEVFFAPLDTSFDEINTFQPDILFIKKERAHIIGPKKIEGAPDFVVEVLSEGNTPKEMAFKKYIYETFMVGEYWLINLQKKTIAQYLNEEGEFQKLGTFKVSEAVKSVVLEGFQTKLEDLL